MKLQKIILATGLGGAFVVLSGCNQVPQSNYSRIDTLANHDEPTHKTEPVYQKAPVPVYKSGWDLPPLPQQIRSHKSITDYAEQMAMQLVENLNFVNQSNTIAVTSFVDLDDSLMNTSVLGNHLSDSLMGEMQRFGLSVLDHKAMDVLKVNSAGDFVLSRDHTALRNPIDVDYVLAGTMTHTNRGILFNARVIGMKSKVVVSSASVLIPNFIISSIYSSGYRDGIYFGN